MKFLAVLVLVGVAVAFPPLSPEFDQSWSEFKSTYNKMYNPRDETLRRLVFEQNMRLIESHNAEADMGMHTYWLGVNEYADMTNREFVAMMNGYNKTGSPKIKGSTFLPPSNMGALPTSVDWRTKGYVTPIKNQGQCGSCWAFSATGSLEGQHFKSTQKLVSLSEQNLVDCSTAEGNLGCDGGLMDQAFTYIKKNKGIDTEASYPYKARDQKCKFNPANVGATDTGFTDIKSKDEMALQTAIATVGPISVAIDASHNSFQLYKSGVYNEPRCSQTQLDHGVLAVGYGVDGTKDYYIVKNSWGTSWGMKGYIWMSRNKNNQCGIATASSYPTV